MSVSSLPWYHEGASTLLACLRESKETRLQRHFTSFLTAFPSAYWRDDDRAALYDAYPFRGVGGLLDRTFFSCSNPDTLYSEGWRSFFEKEARYCPFALCSYLLDRKLSATVVCSVITPDCLAFLAATEAASAQKPDGSSSNVFCVGRSGRR